MDFSLQLHFPCDITMRNSFSQNSGRRGRDRMVFGCTTTCAISDYNHLSCEFEPRSWRAVLDTTLCDKV